MQTTTDKFTTDMYKVILDMRNSGKTLKEISKFIARNNITSHRGKPYSESGMNTILRRASEATGVPVRKFGPGRPHNNRPTQNSNTTQTPTTAQVPLMAPNKKVAVDHDFFIRMVLQSTHLGALKQLETIRAAYGMA